MKRRIIITIASLVTVFALVVGALAFASPLIIRTVLNAVAKRAGVTIDVGEVRGWVLSPVVLNNTTIATATGDTLLQADELSISYGVFRILRGNFDFEQVALVAPRLRLNLRNQTTTTPPTAGVAIPNIFVQRLEVSDGTVQVTTQGGATRPYDARNITLDLTDLAIRRGGDSLSGSIARLQANLDEPRINIRHFEGDIALHADTVSVNLPRIELTDATGSLRGWFLAASPTQHANLDVSFANLTPEDVPVQPTWLPREAFRVSGLGRVSVNEGHGYELSSDSVDIRIDGTPMLVALAGGMTVHPDGTWQLSRSVVQANELPTHLLPGFDAPTLNGTIGGRVVATGPSQALDIDLDMTYLDLRNRASSRLSAAGEVAATHPADTEFRRVQIRQAQVDLRTLREWSDHIPATGQVTARGDVSGPWRTPVFNGTLTYGDSGQSASVARGEIRGIDYANLRIDSLQPPLIRALVSPDVPLREVVSGQLELRRAPDTIFVVTSLRAARAGSLSVRGDLVSSSAGTSARADFAIAGVNAYSLDSLWPFTSVYGTGNVSFEKIDQGFNTWQLVAELDSSVVENAFFRSVRLAASRNPTAIAIDSLYLRSAGLQAEAQGILFEDDSTTSRIDFSIDLDSLAHALEIARPWIPAVLDSLDGAMSVEGTVTGSLRNYTLHGRASGSELKLRGATSTRLTSDVVWNSSDKTFETATQMDSLAIATFLLANARVSITGGLDSIAWSVAGQEPGKGSLLSTGHIVRHDGMNLVRLDSALVPAARQTWALLQPTEIILRDSTFSVDSLLFGVPGQDALVALNGMVSPAGSSQLRGSVRNVQIEDVSAFLGLDSPSLGGLLNASFDVAGTLANPKLNAVMDVAEPRIRTNTMGRTHVTLEYADSSMQTTVQLSTDTSQVGELTATLPMLLQLSPLRFERREGALRGTLQATNAPLRVLGPFFPTWRNPEGVFVANATIGGTWDLPEFAGTMSVQGGQVDLPDIGIQLTAMDGQLNLRGDTVTIEHFAATSGEGSATVVGFVELRDLTNPVFSLDLNTNEFTLMALRDYMTTVVTGDAKFTGSFDQPNLVGRGVVNRGSISFADVIEKQIVDLSDPLFATFIDTAVIRAEGLDQISTSQLWRRLRIDTLHVNLGNDFWMRSGEGDVQLTGDITVNKVARVYRFDGTLNAPRGTYRLQLAPGVTREFIVTRGTVRYFGTTDLDADLDIDARYTVRSFGGSPINIFAHLGGTLYHPTVQLSSDIRPAVSDDELIAYLLFGSPSVQAFADQGGNQRQFLFQEGVDQFAAALSGQLAQSLVRGLRLPLDYLQIKPGNVGQSFSGTEIALGKQFTFFNRPGFLTASPRICPGQSLLSAENLGASLTSNLTGRWSLAASVDPVSICETAVAPLSTRYQLGVDLIWSKR